MSDPLFSVAVSRHASPKGPYIKCTTYGIRNGVYGSIGVVLLPTVLTGAPTDLADLARLLLTALYGMDYDL